MLRSRIYQDQITNSIAHPIYDGRAVTIQNLGTHRLWVGSALLVPGAVWIASSDHQDNFNEIPSLRFEVNEWRDFINLAENELPMTLDKKGKLATVQYIKDHVI
jgi:hypothetical protein